MIPHVPVNRENGNWITQTGLSAVFFFGTYPVNWFMVLILGAQFCISLRHAIS